LRDGCCTVFSKKANYLNPELIQRMRKELRHQFQDGFAPVDVGQLKQKLAQLEKDLQTARRNMALAEPGLLQEYEEVFRELRSRQAYRKSEIKAGNGAKRRAFGRRDRGPCHCPSIATASNLSTCRSRPAEGVSPPGRGAGGDSRGQTTHRLSKPLQIAGRRDPHAT
jgi:hypothetical protein